MYGQGWVYCDESMAEIDETLDLWHCQPILWGCIWMKKYQLGQTCTYMSTQGTWCPRVGSYVSGYIGTGSGDWKVYLQVDVYDWSGGHTHVQIVGNTQTF